MIHELLKKATRDGIHKVPSWIKTYLLFGLDDFSRFLHYTFRIISRKVEQVNCGRNRTRRNYSSGKLKQLIWMRLTLISSEYRINSQETNFIMVSVSAVTPFQSQRRSFFPMSADVSSTTHRFTNYRTLFQKLGFAKV